MRYDITAKNRFTGKVYEEHENKGVNAVYRVQDYYLFQPWVKIEVYPVGKISRRI